MSRVERHAAMYEEDAGRNEVIEAADIKEAEAEVKEVKVAIQEVKESVETSAERNANLTWRGKLLLTVGTVILALSLVVCAVLMLPKFLGIKTYLVASGSMVPTIPVGSMIYAKEVNPVNLEEGDIIVFFKGNDEDVPITHRVVTNDPEAKTIVTKGDANSKADPAPILYNNVVGKVVWHVPVLGLMAVPLTKPIGKLILVLIVFEGFLLAEVGARMRKKHQKIK